MTIFDLVKIVHEKQLEIRIFPCPGMPDSFVNFRIYDDERCIAHTFQYKRLEQMVAPDICLDSELTRSIKELCKEDIYDVTTDW